MEGPLSNYSREATVAAVRRYYQFLTSMYLNPSYVIELPEGGWPEITSETMGSLGKIDEVIALLRELPYIQRDQGERDVEGSPMCLWADWNHTAEIMRQGYDAASVLDTSEDRPDEVPAHVFGLTSGGGQNERIHLDTLDGNVYWLECPDFVRFDPDLPYGRIAIDEEHYPEKERDWRCCGTVWTMEDFFEVLQYQFNKLNFIPIDETRVRAAHYFPQSQTEAIQTVFSGTWLARSRPIQQARLFESSLKMHGGVVKFERRGGCGR